MSEYVDLSEVSDEQIKEAWEKSNNDPKETAKSLGVRLSGKLMKKIADLTK